MQKAKQIIMLCGIAIISGCATEKVACTYPTQPSQLMQPMTAPLSVDEFAQRYQSESFSWGGK